MQGSSSSFLYGKPTIQNQKSNVPDLDTNNQARLFRQLAEET